MIRLPRRLAAAAFALAIPAAAHACAVCSVLDDERTRKALFNATMFLSLLPLAAIAFGLWWFARRAGAALRTEFQESPDAVPAAPAESPRH